jgi:hypothetical protein
MLWTPTQKGEQPYFSKRTKKLDFFFIFDINEKFYYGLINVGLPADFEGHPSVRERWPG